MTEWLLWFNLNKLPNVQEFWLPPNAAPRFQPMDQGIIRAFKAYYRREIIKHVIKHVESTPEVTKDDPYRTVNVLHAVQWAMDA